MNKPTVIFDTVVFVRALINPASFSGALVFKYSNRYHLVFSPQIIREVVEVLDRPELRRLFRSLDGLDLKLALRIIAQAPRRSPRGGAAGVAG